MALSHVSGKTSPLYVVGKDGQPPSNGPIFNQLFALVDSTLEHHREDLTVHDANQIACLGSKPFIHVSYRAGTHLHEVPRPIKDNSRVKYLFGHETPSGIYRQALELLTSYYGRPDYFGYKHLFVYSDGVVVRKVSQKAAIDIYRTALTGVLQELRRTNQPMAL